ncbi:hypothetical protein FACS1894158_13910 [Betaproteobacteria bacterium]|nr:hypothetical protein FACS1894158_13910 [Betaproteobacteria bacterium]
MGLFSRLTARLRAYLIRHAERRGMLPSRARGIVFVAPHPKSSDSGDGFLQRVREIDAGFSYLPRWYIRVIHRGKAQVKSYPDGSFFIHLPFWHIPLLLAVIGLLLHNKILYIHSIYGCICGTDTLLQYVPSVFRVFDIHGIVPEELRYCNASFHLRFIAFFAEKIAVTRAHCLIAVTKKMINHINKKYKKENQINIILPIFNDFNKSESSKTLIDIKSFFDDNALARPGIIYAGGTQHWQQFPRTLAAIKKQSELARYFVLTHTPPVLPPDFSEFIESCSHIRMASSLTPSQVAQVYPYFQYGFLLRETNIVNRVACPTKIIEYLEHGIIPIMLSPDLGDFDDLGLQYLSLDKFEQGKLLSPDEFNQAIQKNLLLLEKLKDRRKQDFLNLKNLLHAIGTESVKRSPFSRQQFKLCSIHKDESQ